METTIDTSSAAHMSPNQTPYQHLPQDSTRTLVDGSALPTVIDATKNGMINSFTTMAIVATLLAATEGVFLSIIKQSSSQSPSQDSSSEKLNSNQLNAMVTLTYLAILFNIGASWSALRMIDILGKMTFHVAKRNSSNLEQVLFRLDTVRDVNEAMRRHGVAGIWCFFAWHCWFSLIIGSLSFVAQILIYVWINEAPCVSISITVLAGVALIPVFCSLFF